MRSGATLAGIAKNRKRQACTRRGCGLTKWLVYKETALQDLILHLGAHRTASTYVQGVLGKNAGLLAENGIGMPAQEATRAALTERLNPRLPTLPMAGGFDRLLSDTGVADCQTIILSDENMLGFLNEIFAHHKFYPNTRARLKRLSRLLPVSPSKIMLGIRPYETFFPSAYSRWLSPGRPVLPREDIAGIVLGFQRGWDDLIQEITEVFPEAELMISEYHSDASYGLDQLHQLLGPCAEQLEFTTGYRWNRSMSGHQTHRYEQALLHGEHNGQDADTIRSLIRLGQTPLSEGFWADSVLHEVQSRYQQDLERILKQVPAFVMAPDANNQDAT